MAKLKKWLPAFIIAGIALVFTLVYIINIKTSIQLNGDPEVTIEYGDEYIDKGAEGTYSTLFKKNQKLDVTVEGLEDATKTVGENTVTYSVKYWKYSSKITRKITVKDSVAPEITLTTDDTYYTEPDEEYQEEGYQATDNYDGDITDKVTSTIADGIVTYTVKDSSGNETTVTRKIRYADHVAPVLTLSGGNVSITLNGTYNESGYSAIDDQDGDITSQVVVSGSVNTAVAGTYTLTYSVTDAFGNVATQTRTVTVTKPVVKTVTQQVTGNKIIYLTFDDGPGPYTQKLLDILAKYNVKATFFVTAQFPAYLPLIAKEYAAGHTVAIHTYTHNYSIYASSATFWNDFNQMNAVIQQYTGQTTTLFRFPGGSSNAVSKSYCIGIMTQLTQEANANGYTYFDWNVTSGDAGGTTSSDVVYSNVISGIQKCNVSVVLQHDIKSYSVDAVERIIQWGQANGYTFLPLDAGSYTAHHGVNN